MTFLRGLAVAWALSACSPAMRGGAAVSADVLGVELEKGLDFWAPRAFTVTSVIPPRGDDPKLTAVVRHNPIDCGYGEHYARDLCALNSFYTTIAASRSSRRRTFSEYSLEWLVWRSGVDRERIVMVIEIGSCWKIELSSSRGDEPQNICKSVTNDIELPAASLKNSGSSADILARAEVFLPLFFSGAVFEERSKHNDHYFSCKFHLPRGSEQVVESGAWERYAIAIVVSRDSETQWRLIVSIDGDYASEGALAEGTWRSMEPDHARNLTIMVSRFLTELREFLL